LVGKPDLSPDGVGNMVDYIKRQIPEFLYSIEFIEGVTAEEIPNILSKSDVCVFPSIWENFPNVCLEAMSAARGIIASSEGGMRDMLEDIEGGILIEPSDFQEIANKIIKLLSNCEYRVKMGERARNKVISHYGLDLVDSTIQFYQGLINSH
jgi:glycosyltransferase involved in cell wall biosynthesis